MGVIDETLEANRRYADERYRAGQQRPPTRGLAVVACMDSRVQPYEMLGLQAGEAHILRNAGGVVTEDVIRSLIVSHYIGGTREVMLVHNTECGMTTFQEEELLARVKEDSGVTAFAPAHFHAFSDPAESVREDVRKVRSHPWIPRSMTVRGFVFDVDTGLLTEVTHEPRSREAAPRGA